MAKVRIKAKLVVPDAPLKFGDRNLNVIYLQQCLQKIYKCKPSIVGEDNGHYGALTETTVRHFQADHGLHIDGRYTDLTRRVLREVIKCLK